MAVSAHMSAYMTLYKDMAVSLGAQYVDLSDATVFMGVNSGTMHGA